MREFLRVCLVWFVGYPLSVLAASVVLSAAAWTGGDPVRSGVSAIFGLLPVVGFFGVFPALATAPSPSLCHYTASGARTGGVIGLFAVSLYVIVFTAAAFDVLHRGLAGGAFPAGAIEMLGQSAALIAALVSLFVVAGACGGTVFGLFARRTVAA